MHPCLTKVRLYWESFLLNNPRLLRSVIQNSSPSSVLGKEEGERRSTMASRRTSGQDAKIQLRSLYSNCSKIRRKLLSAPPLHDFKRPCHFMLQLLHRVNHGERNENLPEVGGKAPDFKFCNHSSPTLLEELLGSYVLPLMAIVHVVCMGGLAQGGCGHVVCTRMWDAHM